MRELFETQVGKQNRKSSKGNQLKWCDGAKWYKADYTGYEGLAEYVISHLLLKSNLKKGEFVLYDVEEICYKTQVYHGCMSENFLPEGWQLITLERLFQNHFGTGLNKCVYTIREHEERLRFLVGQTERITGISGFGNYMCKLLTVDSFFLNEDRHSHNIAVLMDPDEHYHLCPIFDQGAGLLSDTTMDYPMQGDIYELENLAKPKTFCQSFDEQLEIAEKLYGQGVHFYFTKKDVDEILDAVEYDKAVKERVRTLVYGQMRKYPYLFKQV